MPGASTNGGRMLLVIAYLASRAVMLVLPPYASDAQLYHAHAATWASGALPYRDAPFEYPPLAALLCYLPMLLHPSGWVAYRWLFASAMLLVDLAAFCLLLREARRRELGNVPPWLYLLLTALMQPLIFDRLDLAVGFLVLLGVLPAGGSLAARARAYASLLLGGLLKFVPVLIVPLLARACPATWRRDVSTLFVLPAIVLCTLFAVWLGPGVVDPVRYHAGRGIQIESLWANVALVGHVLGASLTMIESHHAQEFTGGWAAALLPLAAPVNAIAVLAVLAWLVAWPRRDLIPGALLVLLAFIASCPVLSPQFLLWIIPAASLALAGPDERRARRWLIALLVPCVAVTSYLFRCKLWALASLQGDGLLLLSLRNVLLLGVLVVLARAAARPACSGWHIAAGDRRK